MQPKQRPQKPKESKYVSIFSDSRPDSDISFRDAAEGLLRQSAERYVVGVDNLTVSMDGFSMIDQTLEPEVLLEVLLLQHRAVNADLLGNETTWLNFPADFRYADSRSYQLRNDSTNITTFADVIIRLNEIAAAVHENLKNGVTNANGDETEHLEISPAAVGAVVFDDGKHLRFTLDVTGHITIRASRFFWATHMIHIPIKKYQRIFLGTSWKVGEDQRIVSLSPFDLPELGAYLGTMEATGAELAGTTANTIEDKLLVLDGARGYVRRWAEIKNASFVENVNDGQVTWFNYIRTAPNASAAAKAWREVLANFMLLGNIYSTFDRRVCIEVGTSLPLKNSPLIEDNREASDFILGRFFINSGIRIESDVHGEFRQIAHHGPSLYTLMDGSQRVLYHQLNPQQKITTMRVKLYARVRTYDEAADTWGMRVISLPTELTDWWHIRLHFKEIDEATK